jgi:peptidoglycan/LPS O-acetylase OafA/YrhL
MAIAANDIPRVPAARRRGTASAKPRTGARTKVRIEIQALRAVAVLLVVGYHLWPEAVPGGFVGVDVFFVISGFLITSLLLREIDRSGRISLSGFWARRARRILPAALIALLFCAAATAAVVPLSHWQQYYAEMRASTAYVQNWHLSAAAVDYFAAQNEPSPVQHYWSLSAEEQFYLLWPLMLGFALLITRRGRARTRRRAIAVVMATVAAVSLVYGLYATARNPASAYFVTPTRAWEFGAGGLLAFVPQFERSPMAGRTVLSWIGLAAIATAALAYTDATRFPGYAALLPVLGTVAVIRAGAPIGRGAPTRLLALPPVQFLGDISYSIYLWHWPLLVLAPFALDAAVGTGASVGILMLTILIAWLSKHLIEDPVRSGAFFTRRTAAWSIAAAAAATVAVFGVTVGGSAHVQTQLHKSELAAARLLAAPPQCFGAASRDPEHPCHNPRLRLMVVPTPLQARNAPNAACTVIQRTGLVQVCAFGTPAARATAKIALIGDSHAMHWRGALNVVARTKGWQGLSITHASCPLSRATRDLPQPDRSRCDRWRRQTLQWLRRHPEVDTIFVAGLSGGLGVIPTRGRSGFETAVAGFAAAWRALPRSVRHVVVLRDTAKARAGATDCVERAMARRTPAGLACAGSRRVVLNRDPAVTAAARLRSPRIQTIDLTQFFCDRARCFPVIGGALVYKDPTHVTAVYSRTLGPFLTRRVSRLMAGWS